MPGAPQTHDETSATEQRISGYADANEIAQRTSI